MKRVIFLLIFFTTIFSNSCKKEDLTSSFDITQDLWKVKNVTIDGDKTKPAKGDDYFLEFKSDSVFSLNTSTNTAGGSYNIISKGLISIFYYHEYTEVGGLNDFDKTLLQEITKITSYQVLSDYLILEGNNVKIKLKKNN